MGRNVKHYVNRAVLNTDWCYRVEIGGKAAFFIDEKDYTNYLEDKAKENRLRDKYNKMWKIIIPVYFHKTLYSRMAQIFNEVYSTYPHEYLWDKFEYVENSVGNYMNTLEFKSGQHMASYLIKALTNVLERGIIDYMKIQKKKDRKVHTTESDLMALTNVSRVSIEVDSIDEFLD